ncbi:MAG: DNRLRE domain-containing protein, partial [Anaerolineae bacterium]|nr:DNRLRE domain-containing protein [Anaerolineae bacterium]
SALLAIGDSSASASAKYRTFLQFDLSGIPSDATIVSAKLLLYEYDAYDTASIGSWDATLYRIIPSWTGSQLTWNIRATGQSWGTAGASLAGKDYDSTEIASVTMDGAAEAGFVEWSDNDLLTLVKRWVAGTYTNNGLALVAATAESQGTTPLASNLFRSVDYSIPEHRPRLVVVYREAAIESDAKNSYLDLMAAPAFGFDLRFESIDPDTFAATDITDMVTACDTIWMGEITPAIYGWAISISGNDYDEVLLAPGTQIAVYRAFTIDGVDVDGEQRWFQGYIQPGTVSISYNTEAWSLTFVDILTYLGGSVAPVFSIGKLNVASDASVIADSVADARDVSDEGEYVGLPPLDADQAIDGDIGTLWISAKAPAVVEVPSNPDRDLRQVSEVYEPGFGLDRQLYQWIEICAPNDFEDVPLKIMTRYGKVRIDDFIMGEPFGGPTADNQMRFGIVGHNAERFQQLFGTVRHAPFFSMPMDWGFNLDGEGDYIAIDAENDNYGDRRWRTMYVAEGSRMGTAATGTWTGEGGAWVTVDGIGTYAEGDLDGWFIQYGLDSLTGIYWAQNRIQANDATVGTETKLYVNEGFAPDPDDSGNVRVTAFPAGLIPEWPLT